MQAVIGRCGNIMPILLSPSLSFHWAGAQALCSKILNYYKYFHILTHIFEKNISLNMFEIFSFDNNILLSTELSGCTSPPQQNIKLLQIFPRPGKYFLRKIFLWICSKYSLLIIISFFPLNWAGAQALCSKILNYYKYFHILANIFWERYFFEYVQNILFW